MKQFAFFISFLLLCITSTYAQQFRMLPETAADPFAQFRVFPNPTHTGAFTLELQANQDLESISIKLYNLIGKEVLYRKASVITGEFKLNLSIQTLPKGVYTIEIVHGDFRETRRLSFI